MNSTPNYSLAPCAGSQTLRIRHQARRSSDCVGDRGNPRLRTALCRRKRLRPQCSHQQTLRYKFRARLRLVAVLGCLCRLPQNSRTSRQRRPRRQAANRKSQKLSRKGAGAPTAVLSWQRVLPSASTAVKSRKFRRRSAVLVGQEELRPTKSRPRLLHRARLPRYPHARANAAFPILRRRPALLQA